MKTNYTYLLVTIIGLLILPLINTTVVAQTTVGFEGITSPNCDFTFDTMEKYKSGLVKYNLLQLNVVSDKRWDLYVAANVAVADSWDVDQYYSNSGPNPDIDILSLRFRNASNTSNEPTFFPIRHTSDPVYIIGTDGTDGDVLCGAGHTNVAGTYVTESNCYQFNVDVRVKPEMGDRAGSYHMEIVFTILEDI